MRQRARAALALLALLCAGPAGLRAQERAPGAGPGPYGSLLARYVMTVSPQGTQPGPIETRFDYLALHAAKDRDPLLAAARGELFDGATPSKWSHARRLAWAIDAYNLLVIEAVTKHLVPARQGGAAAGPLASVLDLRIGDMSLFGAPLVEVEGATYSLDAFERVFVFGNFDRKAGGPPPEALDPRAHFALVCGARGCPPLMPFAWRSDSLDARLDFAARNALASTAHLRWHPQRGTLEASSIFDWYAADFGGSEGVMAFIRKHAPDAVGKDLERRGVRTISAFIPWSWRLNQTPAGTR